MLDDLSMERDESVRVLESRVVGYAGIPQNVYSGFSILGHHDEAVIYADWLRSEELAKAWLAEMGEV